MVNWLRSLRGYVCFSVEGAGAERFFSLLARNGYQVFSSAPIPNGMQACLPVSQYRKVRAYAKKCGVHVRVVQRYGWRFLLHRYRRRVGIFLGCGAFLLFLWIMSGFLWKVEVVGDENLDSQQVLEQLEQVGVHVGAWKRDIDVTMAQWTMLREMEDLAWIAINIQGSTATVDVRAQVKAPEMLDTTTPCDVVAAADGYITYMEVYQGQKVLEVGDTVRKGEVLVSGVAQWPTGGTNLLHASAKVLAQTPRTFEVTVPLQEEQLVPVGSVEEYPYLQWGSQKLRLFWRDIPDGPAILRESQRPVTLFGWDLPLQLVTVRRYAAEKQLVSRTPQEAKELAQQRQNAFEHTLEMGGTIVEKTVQGEETDQGYHLKVEYIWETNIAQQQPLNLEEPQT